MPATGRKATKTRAFLYFVLFVSFVVEYPAGVGAGFIAYLRHACGICWRSHCRMQALSKIRLWRKAPACFRASLRGASLAPVMGVRKSSGAGGREGRGRGDWPGWGGWAGLGESCLLKGGTLSAALRRFCTPKDYAVRGIMPFEGLDGRTVRLRTREPR